MVIDVPDGIGGEDDMAAWLNQNGYRSLSEMLRVHFGPPVPALAAHRGDVVYTRDGVVGIADRVAWLVGEHGLITRKLSDCRYAFRVSP
jgi:Holliday junction resolvase-like predicted endonuclease